MLVTGCAGASRTLEEVSPHFSANTQIIWRAESNSLPTKLWVYKKVPRVFSAAMISNAVVLASFQKKGFPAPSTNDVVVWLDDFAGEPEPPNLAFLSREGQLSFTLGDRIPEKQRNIIGGESAVKHGWNCLIQLGVDGREFVNTNSENDGKNTVVFPRQVNGIPFLDGSGEFSFQQFGSNAAIGSFSLLWPKLEPLTFGPTACPQQIIDCIRAFKTPVVPNDDEGDYAAFLKSMEKVKIFTITKITAYYGDGVYGESPTNGETSNIVMPVAQLDATADFGGGTRVVRMYSPILSSEVTRLLGKKMKTTSGGGL